VWSDNIEMLLKKILHHEVSYTYKTECGSRFLQTEGKQYDYRTWVLTLKDETVLQLDYKQKSPW
jgi:hypothetical protein